MAEMVYRLRYLPLFEKDLSETLWYIGHALKNPQAAEKLANEIEAAILKRLSCPLAFEPYPSQLPHDHPYYRIYVGNFTVYYVVIEDAMEVRRLIYSKRDWQRLLP